MFLVPVFFVVLALVFGWKRACFLCAAWRVTPSAWAIWAHDHPLSIAVRTATSSRPSARPRSATAATRAPSGSSVGEGRREANSGVSMRQLWLTVSDLSTLVDGKLSRARVSRGDLPCPNFLHERFELGPATNSDPPTHSRSSARNRSIKALAVPADTHSGTALEIGST